MISPAEFAMAGAAARLLWEGICYWSKPRVDLPTLREEWDRLDARQRLSGLSPWEKAVYDRNGETLGQSAARIAAAPYPKWQPLTPRVETPFVWGTSNSYLNNGKEIV